MLFFFSNFSADFSDNSTRKFPFRSFLNFSGSPTNPVIAFDQANGERLWSGLASSAGSIIRKTVRPQLRAPKKSEFDSIFGGFLIRPLLSHTLQGAQQGEVILYRVNQDACGLAPAHTSGR
jgi:hypothetical protein